MPETIHTDKQSQRLRDGVHHGAFLLYTVPLAVCLAFNAPAAPAAVAAGVAETAAPNKLPGGQRLATADEILNGFRRGLFTDVAEEGNRLLAEQPAAPVKGVVAVSIGTSGNLERAETLLKEAAAAKEPSHELHRLLLDALVARNKNDTKAELDACNKALSADASQPVAHLFLAEAAWTGKDFAAALSQTEKALSLEPRMAPAFFLRGMVLRAQKDVAGAGRAFTNAVALDPRDLRPRIAVAEMSQALGNYALAAQGYRAVLTLKPDADVVIRERYLQCLVETDGMSEALKVATKVLESHPTSAVAHLAAGRAQAWLNRRTEALKHLNEFSSKAPKNDGLAPYLIGLCELANGRVPEARTALERSAASPGFKNAALAALGVVAHVEGNRPAAAKALTDALAGAPAALAQRIHFHLGLLALDDKRWDEAKKHFSDSGSFIINLEAGSLNLESLYKQAPDNAVAHTSLGALFISEKMPVSAVVAFGKSMEANKSDVLALLMGSNAFARQLNYEEAAKQLAAVSRVVPKYWPAHYAAGMVEFSRREFDKAIPHYVEALQLNPENGNIHTRLIGTYLATGKSADAEAACMEMINRLPKSPIGYNELAGMQLARGDAGSLKTAEELASRAVELDPKSGACLDTLGWIHFKQEKTDAALQELQKAVSLDPDNAEIQYHVGAALWKAGKSADALHHLKLAVVSAPGSEIAKEADKLLKQFPASNAVKPGTPPVK